MGLDIGFGAEKKRESGSAVREVTASSRRVQREKLNIEENAIEKIIQDILSEAGGLASIFQGEQTAGIFDSSVSAQAAGDLASKLAGEIAKLTAEREITEEKTAEELSTEKTRGKSTGISGEIGIKL